MNRWIFALGLCLFCLGCHSGGSKDTPPTSQAAVPKAGAPTDPDKALYEQVRSGSYQISAAIDTIEETRKSMKDMASRQSGQTQRVIMSVASMLDKAGSRLAEYGDEPPTFEKFKADFSAQDDRRLKAIDAAGLALDDLNDAQDLVEKLIVTKPPEEEKNKLEDADSALDGCTAAVADAIKAMGGKVEDEPN